MIDVCVVTYRNEDTVAALAASVAEVLPQARLLVCDNSPDEATVDALRVHAQALGLDLKILAPAGNVGFGAGCNRLAAASDREWLLFLNPDAELKRFDLNLQDVPPHSIIGALVHLPDGTVQDTFGPERTLAEEARIRLLRRPSVLAAPTDGRMPVAFVSGAAFLTRCEDMRQWRGFDAERYFMYYEDIDLCRRVRVGGGSVAIDPRFVVGHVGGFSARKEHAVALIRSYRSAAAYHERWGDRRRGFAALCAVEATLKLALSLPRGRVGTTSRGDQSALLRHILQTWGRRQSD